MKETKYLWSCWGKSEAWNSDATVDICAML